MKTSVTITRKPEVIGVPISSMRDGDIGEILEHEYHLGFLSLVGELIFNVQGNLFIRSQSKGTYFWEKNYKPFSSVIHSMKVRLIEPGDSFTITRTE